VDRAYAIPVFHKRLIVAADCGQEQHRLNVVEDMYPLLPFGSLTANIEHAVCQIPKVKQCFADSSGSQPCAKDVLIGW